MFNLDILSAWRNPTTETQNTSLNHNQRKKVRTIISAKRSKNNQIL